MKSQIAIALICVASCGAEDRIDATIDGSLETIRKSLNRSGTRIERWAHVATSILTDGTEIDEAPTYTLHDTKYNWDCTIQKASDGKMRCLPGSAYDMPSSISITFLDSGCTTPIVAGTFIDSDPGTKVGRDSNNDLWLYGSMITPAPDEIYTSTGGICSKMKLPTYGAYPHQARQLSAKLSASDFIGVASSSPADTRL